MIPAPTPKARLALLLSVTLGLPVAALAQDDTPARSPADTALLSTIVGMDFGKQSAVYDRLGFDPGTGVLELRLPRRGLWLQLGLAGLSPRHHRHL